MRPTYSRQTFVVYCAGPVTEEEAARVDSGELGVIGRLVPREARLRSERGPRFRVVWIEAGPELSWEEANARELRRRDPSLPADVRHAAWVAGRVEAHIARVAEERSRRGRR